MGRRKELLRTTARRFPRLAWIYRNLAWAVHEDKSQFGEQALLTAHLPPSGLFLEVGAFQPIMFSNTWALERRGWKGVAVDANPEYAFAWRLFRRRTPFWAMAVTPSAQGEAVLFLTDPRYGAVSSLRRDHVERWSIPEGMSVHERVVRTLTVPELLKSYERNHHRPPDFVQFDCEGMDAELVEALLTDVDFEHLPTFLMIESLEAGNEPTQLADYYQELGTAGVSRLLKKRTELATDQQHKQVEGLFIGPDEVPGL